jgi:hypothetical protein
MRVHQAFVLRYACFFSYFRAQKYCCAQPRQKQFRVECVERDVISCVDRIVCVERDVIKKSIVTYLRHSRPA